MAKTEERSLMLARKKIMVAIFGTKIQWYSGFPICYPCCIVEEKGQTRTFYLSEAIKEALDSLPLTKGRDDPKEWGRFKRALELRFGLIDGRERRLTEVGKELGEFTSRRASQIINRAIRILRQPSHSERLRLFLVPSPEQIMEEKGKLRKLLEDNQVLREENSQLERKNQPLVNILKEQGIKIEDLEKVKPEDIRLFQEKFEQFKAIILEYPNKRLWNIVRRELAFGHITFSSFKEKILSGKVRGIRKKSAALAFLENKASEIPDFGNIEKKIGSFLETFLRNI